MTVKKDRKVREYALAIDAGGTFFKSGLVAGEGSVLKGSEYTVPIDAEGDPASIFEAYKDIVRHAEASVREYGGAILGMGISTPGPFDIHSGRSLMTHKFRCLFQLDLGRELRARLRLNEDFPICFIHDVFAFLKGELWKGGAAGLSRVMAVTLGTGLGFGCFLDGQFEENEIGGPRVSLFKTPFCGGMLEDRISRRGILKAYAKRVGWLEASNWEVRDLAERAREGRDPDAAFVFRETGEILGIALEPLCRASAIEGVIFGGQISRSFDLIAPGLAPLQDRVKCIRKLTRAASIDDSALIGAGSLVFARRG